MVAFSFCIDVTLFCIGVVYLKKGTTLISRQASKEALSAFDSTLKNVPEDEELSIDFNGVITFSPSWGDEFLTPLLRRYGKRFKLLKTNNPSVIATIETLEEVHDLKFQFID